MTEVEDTDRQAQGQIQVFICSAVEESREKSHRPRREEKWAGISRAADDLQ